ncbi:MAG: glyoxalase/bleomycin resistance protein/dioxygenase [Betaproteobacteria bacterium]|nr:glyoxalase/bleomycin resistance protein/dioxygenase [Betaproteobacteria bacterium]
MPLHHLEHFLIQTADMAATRDWYVSVLGLREGEHPDFKFPVCWMYIGDTDVIHITEGGKDVSENRKRYLGQQSDAVEGTGVIDHVAFRCSGLGKMMEHLRSAKVPFSKRQVDDQGLFQLFLVDPNGIKVELNFANSEAAGIAPELMAASLTS